MANETDPTQALDKEDVADSTTSTTDFRKMGWRTGIVYSAVMVALYLTLLGFGFPLLRVGAPRLASSSGATSARTFVLSMPPYGDSQRFSVRAGETPHYTGIGKRFEGRWLCASGKTSKESDPKGSWCQGDILAYWFHDLSGSENSVTVTIR